MSSEMAAESLVCFFPNMFSLCSVTDGDVCQMDVQPLTTFLCSSGPVYLQNMLISPITSTGGFDAGWIRNKTYPVVFFFLFLILKKYNEQQFAFSKEHSSPNTADYKEQRKREKQRLERERREQKEREKKENEMKKKFKVRVIFSSGSFQALSNKLLGSLFLNCLTLF